MALASGLRSEAGSAAEQLDGEDDIVPAQDGLATVLCLTRERGADVARLLRDFDACVSRSSESLARADEVSRRALNLVARLRDEGHPPSVVLRRVRESILPPTNDE